MMTLLKRMMKAFMPSVYYKSICKRYVKQHRDHVDLDLASMAIFLPWKAIAEKIVKHENLRDVDELDLWLSSSNI